MDCKGSVQGTKELIFHSITICHMKNTMLYVAAAFAFVLVWAQISVNG